MKQLLIQDDATPDSFAQFNEEFTKIVGLDVNTFQVRACREFHVDYINYTLNNYILEYDVRLLYELHEKK